ncbi:MAG TPA: ADOP family duplicated permease, partial [Longimicrobiales bacterium]|nr:ADOP family duplicated permease [Longimicrobiales bacterium]
MSGRDRPPRGRRHGFHGRTFRLLLRLYPRPFRRAYGEEMTEYFLERLARARERRGRRGVAGVWVRAAADVARTAATERLGRATRWGRGDGHGTNPTRGGAGRMRALMQDLRYGARRLGRTPLFTAAAVGILAVGIGANAGAFAVVDAVLLRPPPFERPEEIVSIYQDSDDGVPSSTSFPAYEDMAGMTDVFAGVAAISPGVATWEAPDGPEQVSVIYATASYFPVLGLEPSRGRWFSSEHDEVGAGAYAVVTHRAWRTEMGSDPGIVGRTIRVNGQPVTVIGVGPQSFNGARGGLVADFWLSISSTVVGGPFRVANLDRRQDHWYDVQARLAPGVGVARARAAMDGLARRLAEAYPDLNRGREITVFAHDEVRLHPEVDGDLASAGAGLLAVVGLVLLLACANLANLLLVRGVSRSSEMALRRALGASRTRVARLFLGEALLLSALGGAAGLLVARWAVGFLPRLPLPLPGATSLDVAVDHRVALFSVGLVLVTGALFGLAPGLRTARTDVASALREDQRTASTGRGTSLLRGGLVALQVAVSLVLVVAAGLLTRSLANARGVDPGVDVDRLAAIGTNFRQANLPQEEWPVVTDELLRRVRAIPGVRRAAIASRLPVQGSASSTTVVEGYDPPSGTGATELAFAFVGAGYFRTMGIPLVEGRTFTEEDRPESPRVVLVNETGARRFWGGEALGRRIRPQGAADAWRRVVGVVGDVKVEELQEPPTPLIYFSADQQPLSSFFVVARTDGDPAALIGPLREELRAVRASLPITELGTLESHLGESLSGARTAAGLIGIFSLLA